MTRACLGAVGRVRVDRPRLLVAGHLGSRPIGSGERRRWRGGAGIGGSRLYGPTGMTRRRVTFSRNLTLSLSRTCRCHCKYCAFATHRPHLHEPEEVERLLDGAARRRVKELLVLTGEAPDHHPGVRERLTALGFEDFTP